MSEANTTQPIKKDHKVATILIIMIASAIFTLVMIVDYQKAKNADFDKLQSQQFQCDRWIAEADFLANKYALKNNPNQWTKDDKTEYERLDTLVGKYCVNQQEVALQKLNDCTNHFITIQTLKDKMNESRLESLEQSDQQLYTNTYDKYFQYHCNLIQEKIVKQKTFLDFNITRNGSNW